MLLPHLSDHDGWSRAQAGLVALPGVRGRHLASPHALQAHGRWVQLPLLAGVSSDDPEHVLPKHLRLVSSAHSLTALLVQLGLLHAGTCLRAQIQQQPHAAVMPARLHSKNRGVPGGT